MKAKTPSAILALCLVLLLAQSALPQVASNSPRNVSMHVSNGLESLVPRDGLRFYFEVRNGGLAQLAAMPAALAPMAKLLSAGQTSPSASDLAGFAMRNMSALSGARVAFVSYGAGGQALLIESLSPQDAERLKADMERMLASQDAARSDLSVAMRDRVVMAGARAAVNKVAAADAAFTLVEDQEFNKAQAHFSSEPFFAFVETATALPTPLPQGGDPAQREAFTAAMMSAFNSLPYAVAMGGSFEASTARVRALLMYNPKQKGGLFSSLMSATRLAEPQAPRFAASNTDLFVDLMVDWEKLYEGLESIFGMVAGAQAAGAPQKGGAAGSGLQGGDLLQMMEAQLGFSIKNDLLPTLGGEVAIAVSGFNEVLSAQPKQAKRRAAGPSFTLMLALKDPVKFEKYFTRLFNRVGGKTTQAFARVPYHGTTINYGKSMAYAISGGFLVAGGSAAQIRRALEAKASGGSLASSPEFNQAMGAPRPLMLQVYISSGAANGFFKAVATQAAKMNVGGGLPVPASVSRSAVGVTMTPDTDGLMLDLRVPAELAVLALAALATEKPNAYGINSQTGARPAGRRTPTLTDEDLRARRP